MMPRRALRGPGLVLALVACSLTLRAQRPAHHEPHSHPGLEVPLQPLALQARRLETALRFLGEPLPAGAHEALNAALALPDEAAAVAALQRVLDRHVLVTVHINPESRVRVEQGEAPPQLVQGGTRLFLVKVLNEAGVTAPLAVRSPNSGRVYLPSRGGVGVPEPGPGMTEADVRERWAEIGLYTAPPMRPRLSGLAVEYAILHISSRDAGRRSALVSFDVGQGSQDIGFRNDVDILFTAAPAQPLRLRVQDEHGTAATAGFVVRDEQGRLYPAPSKRLAPDFYFQPQVYRADGAAIALPPGRFTVTGSRGPEYLPQTQKVEMRGPAELLFRFARWIDPAAEGWYPGDHHIHSAGCSHYESPTEGVLPEEIWPQIAGEALSVASVLTWGPSYYFQKQFFTGRDHPLSTPDRLMHYDLEVSGFPSSHAGHLVLLGLQEQDYPETRRLEDWPTWTLPILRWAKAQGAVTGYAHSGWGLEVRSADLPNYEVPGFDGIGANEYIVAVTEPGAVDFISAGDTPYVWELNIWYHALNLGFRTRISGETDFPCITDDRVGQARSYAKVEGPLTYRKWIDAVAAGRSYVSDGKTHLLDFAVNGVAAGTAESEVRLAAPGRVKVAVRVAARLDEHPNEAIRGLRYDEKPYWDLERARVGNTREIPVEVIVNGLPAAVQRVVADGSPRTLTFDVPVDRSSWIAVRVLPAAHTNPVFVLVDGRPIRASRRSAEWALAAVNQCWTQKAAQIRGAELESARQAYDRAREVYRARLADR